MDNRKYILWVEDFDSSSDLFEGFDDSEDTSKETAQAEIKKTFPAYLHNHVEHIKNPTDLPAHMAQHHDDYALIILDVNLEKGMPAEEQLRQDLETELKNSGIILDLSFDFEKNLGYYLYTYFRNKWNIPFDRIVFNSAYVQKDGSEQATRILGSITPPYLEKNNEKNSLQKYLLKHFPDTIDALSIVKAKDILAFWEEYVNNRHESKEKINSIFSKAVANKPNTDAYVSFIEKIKSAFSPVSSEKQLTYWNILAALSHPFEAKPELTDWDFTVFQAIKQVRNICAHRDYTHDTTTLSHEEFLLLFAIGMRALFEDCGAPSPILDAEKWIIKHLKNDYTKNFAENFPNNHPSDDEITSHVKELLISWYFSLLRNMKCDSLSPVHIVITNDRNKYSFSHILQMLCIKATGLHIEIKPQIYSSIKDTGKQSHQRPPILCSYIKFKSESFDLKPRDAWRRIVQECQNQPAVELLLAYIGSQLSYQTKYPGNITIPL